MFDISYYSVTDYLLLLTWTVLPIVVSAALYLLDGSLARKGKKRRPLLKQLVYGVIFGGIAVLNTEFGVSLGGAIINVRDAAPLCAGLVFGPVSGIVAGVIGGVERWFCVYWTAGIYSRLACSISTVFAGFFAAFLRKVFFEDTRPAWYTGLLIGGLMEIYHMTAIFLTHLETPTETMYYVRECTLPMVALNALAVAGTMLVLTRIDRKWEKALSPTAEERREATPKERRLARLERTSVSRQVSIRLFIAVATAFAVSGWFFYTVQNNTVLSNTESMLMQGVNSLMYDISDEADENALGLTRVIAAELNENPEMDLTLLREDYNVADIHVVDESGCIVRSTDADSIGFDFHKDENLPYYEQKYALFLELLEEDGADELVQPFEVVEADSDVERKFAAVKLEGGGFVQVSFTAAQSQDNIINHVRILADNRVIGENGYVLVVDDKLNIITRGYYMDGITLTDIMPELDIWAAQSNMVKINREGTDYYCLTEYAEGFILIGLIPAYDVQSSRDAAVYFDLFLQIIVYSILFLAIYLLIRRTVVTKIKHVNTHLESIIGGNLDTVVDVRSSEEFALLSDAINSTVDTLKTYIAEAEGRIDQELALARQIQQAALPSTFPPYPERKDFALYAVMDAAKEVGGDFYDFFFVGENRLAVLIADVSGKGIPAAMFMMTAKSTIKNLAERGLAVNEVLTAANERLCANNDAEMFVTAWLGFVDLNTGHVEFANAGHNPPYIGRNGRDAEMLKSRPGFVLGGMEGIRYKAQSFDLAPGERLFLYTDGVTEAIDIHEALFGEQRLEQALNLNRYLAAEALLPRVRGIVSDYAGEAEQADDITMLVFDYFGAEESITVTTEPQNEEKVYGFLERVLEQAGASRKPRRQILVAADEIVSNIFKFAYPEGIGELTVTARADASLLSVRFIDSGVPFNPLNLPEPDTSLSAEDRPFGGLGILIVKKTMYSVAYAREDGQNILTVREDVWRK